MKTEGSIYSWTQNDVVNAKKSMDESGYALLSSFVTDFGLEFFRSEISHLSDFKKRKDLLAPTSANTPRKMSVVNGNDISKNSPCLYRLCEAPNFIELLTYLAGEDIFLMNDPVEYAVCNFLEGGGDIHGAHFDKFPYAFTVYVETPMESEGGVLQVAPDITSIENFDAVKKISLPTLPGDAIFMKSGSLAHGITPITALEAKRTVFNVAYVNDSSRNIVSDSSSFLYADD